MKKLIPLLTIAIAFLAACQSDSSHSKHADSTAKSTKSETMLAQCFQSVNNRDSAFATLKFDDKDQITGSLSYNLYEKDKNNGVLAGIVKGDTIIADYTFLSEGTTSIRQIVWLMKNNQLIEGSGEVKETDGKVQFKDIKTLQFGKSLVFNKINCN